MIPTLDQVKTKLTLDQITDGLSKDELVKLLNCVAEINLVCERYGKIGNKALALLRLSFFTTQPTQ